MAILSSHKHQTEAQGMLQLLYSDTLLPIIEPFTAFGWHEDLLDRFDELRDAMDGVAGILFAWYPFESFLSFIIRTTLSP